MDHQKKSRNLVQWTKQRRTELDQKEESNSNYLIYGSLTAILLLTFGVAGGIYYYSQPTIEPPPSNPLIEDIDDEWNPSPSKKSSKKKKGKSKKSRTESRIETGSEYEEEPNYRRGRRRRRDYSTEPRYDTDYD